jgi:hypothetical protein
MTDLRVARYKITKATGAPLVVPKDGPLTVSPMVLYNSQKAHEAAVDASMVPPTFGGSEPITVGGLRWGVSPGSSVATYEGGRLVWVQDGSNGSVHTLTTRAGKVVEFVGTPEMQAALETQIRALFERKRRKARRKR